MPETAQMLFTHKEVTEALIKAAGIHEGIWGVYIEFGIAGTNIEQPDGFIPAAIVPISKIGIQRFTEPNGSTVDAAKVNPVRKPRKDTT